MKFSTGERTKGAKFHVYRAICQYAPLSKNNTGMAALRAGLPVKM